MGLVIASVDTTSVSCSPVEIELIAKVSDFSDVRRTKDIMPNPSLLLSCTTMLTCSITSPSLSESGATKYPPPFVEHRLPSPPFSTTYCDPPLDGRNEVGAS